MTFYRLDVATWGRFSRWRRFTREWIDLARTFLAVAFGRRDSQVFAESTRGVEATRKESGERGGFPTNSPNTSFPRVPPIKRAYPPPILQTQTRTEARPLTSSGKHYTRCRRENERKEDVALDPRLKSLRGAIETTESGA